MNRRAASSGADLTYRVSVTVGASLRFCSVMGLVPSWCAYGAGGPAPGGRGAGASRLPGLAPTRRGRLLRVEYGHAVDRRRTWCGRGGEGRDAVCRRGRVVEQPGPAGGFDELQVPHAHAECRRDALLGVGAVA